MRYADGHKEAVRARIVEAAAESLRTEGLDGVSIPALMRRAGLTHGAFYVHFPSREALVAAAVLHAAHGTGDRVFGAAPDLEAMLAAYLSPGHVAHPEQGCVVAALGTDGPRQPAPVRRAFAEAARGLLRLVQQKLRPGTAVSRLSDEALRLGATMVGAVVLARLVQDEALAARLLRVARSSPGA